MRIRMGLVTVLLAGCPQENGVFEQTQTDTWTQSPTDQVDILFVIDDSNSMTEEQAAVAAGFSSFMTDMEAGQTDFHLAAVSTSFEYDNAARGVFLGEPRVLTKATPTMPPCSRAGCRSAPPDPTRRRGWRARRTRSVP